MAIHSVYLSVKYPKSLLPNVLLYARVARSVRYPNPPPIRAQKAARPTAVMRNLDILFL